MYLSGARPARLKPAEGRSFRMVRLPATRRARKEEIEQQARIRASEPKAAYFAKRRKDWDRETR